MKWVRNILIALGLLTSLGFGLVLQQPTAEKLKTTRANIVDHTEYIKKGKTEVEYAYKNGNRVSDVVPSDVHNVARKSGTEIVAEIKERRGANVKVFTTTNNKIVYEFVQGNQYFQEGGEWWEIDYATTTKDAFDKQTKTPSEYLATFIFPVANAQTFYPSLAEQPSRQVTSETWSTIRGGAGTNVDSGALSGTSYYSPFLNATATTDQYSLYQIPVFPFDTSSITDTDVISSATFSVVTASEFTGNGDLNINISGGVSTPAIGDYDSTISTYSTTFSTDKTISSFTSDNATYNDFAFNASGIAGVSKTGTSVFSMRFSIDINNSGTPTWSSSGQSGIQHRTVNATGTSQDPKLVVVAAPAPVVTGNGDLILFE